MNKLQQIFQIRQNMGSRYFVYRLRHEIERRIGLLERRIPSENLETRCFGTKEILEEGKFYFDRKSMDLALQSSFDTERVERLIKGDLKFFNSEWISLGADYDWITNPKTNFSYPLVHWSRINDYSAEAGDIKYVWEKSRFSWILDFIRCDYHTGSDHSEFVFDQIDSWITANPINKGPNYRCSQEMSLRLWNWSFAFHFYKDSENFSEERWAQYQNVIYWHLHHIYHHIDFSLIAVRNNHAITETGMLFVSRWLFPFIPEVKKWSFEAEKWFKDEIEYQIYEDGTFLQFSMNYHRVVVQTLSAVISLARINDFSLSQVILERSYRSVHFLYQCMGNLEKGLLPNYGQNDGALFFPCTSMDYRDFRPQLNTLHYLLTGEDLFSDDIVNEERSWIGAQSQSKYKMPPIELEFGLSKFEKGGYYLWRETDTLVFLRNGSHKDRPAQADNQHLDLWYKGENILMDSGTYNYNTDKKWLSYFMGTAGHNAIQLAGHDQMLKGGRFIWYYWTQSKGFEFKEHEDYMELEGSILAFQQVESNLEVRRRIRKYKGRNQLRVEDEVLHARASYELIQNWHYPENAKIEIQAKQNLKRQKRSGHFSLYYGKMEANEWMQIKTKSNIIQTEISY